jgi:hypothetical protein
MSVQVDRGRWVVRWRDEFGQQRGKCFDSEQAAREFDGAMGELAPKERKASRSRRGTFQLSRPATRQSFRRSPRLKTGYAHPLFSRLKHRLASAYTTTVEPRAYGTQLPAHLLLHRRYGEAIPRSF